MNGANVLRMKVLYHHRTASKDGQAVHIEEMVNALRQQGHQVLVVAPSMGAEDGKQGAMGGQVGWVGRLKSALPGVVYELLELAYSLVAYQKLLKAARQFNQGFETVEYTSSALVDLALHSQTSMAGLDTAEFEKQELQKIGMPKQILMRHRLPHFGHLFSSSGYASQYYVYLWAEVLDADGFEAFVEAGNPFDPITAQRLRKFIYSSGNTLEPTEAYRAFRGRAPTVTPMLKKKGLLTV